jgi:hypothetical protein
MGKYKRTKEVEVIDSAETEEEAVYLLQEYKLAFGNGWHIWIATKRGCKNTDGAKTKQNISI